MAVGNHILLVGLPRSGTSWVAAVLGASPSVEYEREPITQEWIRDGLRNTSVDPSGNEEYANLTASVLIDDGPRRLIKEVNTFLVPYLIERDDLDIVLLHRHPCAVALSHWERRWTRLDMRELFQVEETGDFWFDHGRLQALLMRPAADTVRRRGRIVAYDTLTQDPRTEYERLASRLSLEWDAAAVAHLESTLGEGRPGDPYSISRDGAIARDRWMKKLDSDQQQAVLRGYSSVRLRGLPKPTVTGYQSRRLTYWRGSR